MFPVMATIFLVFNFLKRNTAKEELRLISTG